MWASCPGFHPITTTVFYIICDVSLTYVLLSPFAHLGLIQGSEIFQVGCISLPINVRSCWHNLRQDAGEAESNWSYISSSANVFETSLTIFLSLTSQIRCPIAFGYFCNYFLSGFFFVVVVFVQHLQLKELEQKLKLLGAAAIYSLTGWMSGFSVLTSLICALPLDFRPNTLSFFFWIWAFPGANASTKRCSSW